MLERTFSALARAITVSLLACGALVLAPASMAADYPSRSVTLIVPFPAGGTADAQARLVGKALASKLGKPVVIDNRPGAGGRIGTLAAARAPADGHTLLMGSVSPLAIEPVLRANASYDPQRDFAPLVLATEMPLVLVVAPHVPAKTLNELIQYGRKSDALTYATWGVGTVSHLVAELFKKSTGARMQHVPYKGGSAAIPDMIGGQVSLMFGLPVDMLPHIQAGRLKAFAVTSPARLPVLPDVPALAESGVSSVDLQAWFGFAVPARTSAEIRLRLERELTSILKSAEFQAWAQGQGVTVIAGPPEALAQRMRGDAAVVAALAKSISLKLED